MNKKLLQSSKDILGGTTVFNGTRVPVKTLIDYLEDGKPIGVFLEDFPSVTLSQAIGVLELAKENITGRHPQGMHAVKKRFDHFFPLFSFFKKHVKIKYVF